MAGYDGGIRENARTGENAERAVYEHLRDNCDTVARTGDGSDFEACGCRNGVEDGLYEAKANDAPLTPRQREVQEQYGPSYHVARARCDDSGECEYP